MSDHESSEQPSRQQLEEAHAAANACIHAVDDLLLQTMGLDAEELGGVADDDDDTSTGDTDPFSDDGKAFADDQYSVSEQEGDGVVQPEGAAALAKKVDELTNTRDELYASEARARDALQPTLGLLRQVSPMSGAGISLFGEKHATGHEAVVHAADYACRMLDTVLEAVGRDLDLAATRLCQGLDSIREEYSELANIHGRIQQEYDRAIRTIGKGQSAGTGSGQTKGDPPGGGEKRPTEFGPHTLGQLADALVSAGPEGVRKKALINAIQRARRQLSVSRRHAGQSYTSADVERIVQHMATSSRVSNREAACNLLRAHGRIATSGRSSASRSA